MNRKNVIIISVLILVGVALATLVGVKFMREKLATRTGYQAVFLTNGQVYFGKLDFEGHWVKLTDIYYLQVTQNLQAAGSGDQNTTATPGTAQNQSNIKLVKLGSELHGPEDAMYIDKDKILFWENMKDDSKVVTAIKQYRP